ncbi:uncharacterized protein MEPE_03074 [Melanopsichium pennsylvanicum]|uniref:Ubiquitin-like domain-containing protein n=2 Tax=Melanopsichium pennsylvanicum TaxID=63383 RepID=A0AAJ4XKS1_9BASI|nr:conserved hypothetical protein [Melanopsichium pennsylvanicum 4]SNX84365.1 uncharacterized protein MEPE_03074 [Melanopsichium pennsylvanicum]
MTDTLDVRIDLGEGPSGPKAKLAAAVRIRPIVVRFTEPGVRDLHLPLCSLLSLRPLSSSDSHTSTAAAKAQGVLFDLDSELSSTHSQNPVPPPITSNSHITINNNDSAVEHNLVQQALSTLDQQGLLGDETVSELKGKIEIRRQELRDRRLRLIHAGRVLREGVRLVGYLEELDVRTRMQSRQQTLRDLALLNQNAADNSQSDTDSDDGQGGDDEERKDTVDKRQMSIRELVEYLSLQACASGTGDHEEQGSSAETMLRGKGKGKSKEPPFYDDVVQVTIRTAPTIYLQCSVGDLKTPSNLLTLPPTSSADALIDTSNATQIAEIDQLVDLSDERNRGFNRLLEAGLSPTEIASIRSTFRSTHPVNTTYDLIQAREHAQHLLEMEESWMDSFHSNPNPGQVFGESDAAEGRGAYGTVFQGLMVGFFMPPLIPLFWFRDKAHPSSLPGDRGGGGGEIGDGANEDDEDEYERETSLAARESVFGSTMQVSILFGLVAK